MSKTSDLAARYNTTVDSLNDLADNLTTIGQNGPAAQVQAASDELAQAVDDLAALDAIDQLTNAHDQTVLANLTKTMNDKNDAITKQESHVTAVVGIVDDLVKVVSNFAAGNVAAAVNAASSALGGLNQLSGGG